MWRERRRRDIAAVQERDAAARSKIEIALLYNGVKAVRAHRRANWLYRHGLRFWARAVSQRCVRRTGIEIHPAAVIGDGLFIDHGVGVVIGETAEIGQNCTLYQGVTLGGTGKDKGKRHPTLGDNVLVGAGAKVLGPITIGNNAKIAAGAVVLDNIPDNCTAVGVPARVVRRCGKRTDALDQVHIPDPVAQELCRMQTQLETLEKQLNLLRGVPEDGTAAEAEREG